jgi:hypothetical protein
MESLTRVLLLVLLLPSLVGATTVTLGWDYTQNPEAQAVGFNVYRQEACAGVFTRMNPSTLPLTPLTFADSTVNTNFTYCWVVTAVDALDQESDPSNAVQFRVSAPASPTTLHGTVTQ